MRTRPNLALKAENLQNLNGNRLKKLTQSTEKSREKAFFKIVETAQLPCEPLMILTDPQKKTAHTIQSILDFIFTLSKMIDFWWKNEKIYEKQPFLKQEIENRTPRKASFPVRIWSFFMWTRGNPKKKTPHTIQTILGFFFFNGKWLFFREKLNFFGYFPGRKRNFRKGWIVWGVFFLGSVRMIRGSHGSWADSMVSKAEILFNFLLIKTIENLFWS